MLRPAPTVRGCCKAEQIAGSLRRFWCNCDTLIKSPWRTSPTTSWRRIVSDTEKQNTLRRHRIHFNPLCINSFTARRASGINFLEIKTLLPSHRKRDRRRSASYSYGFSCAPLHPAAKPQCLADETESRFAWKHEQNDARFVFWYLHHGAFVID